MDNLITITEKDGRRLVSARELYRFLGYDISNWTRWSNKNIVRDSFFEEGLDYQTFVIMTNGNRTFDYSLTLDMAKELSMLARTDKGKTARKYFIEVEKQSQQIIKPISPAQQLLQNAQLLVAQERKLSEHENRLKLLEAKTTGNPDLFTIAGYGNLNNISVNLKIAAKLGRAASKICRDKGLLTDTIADPRFGKVRMYPTKVLEHVFDTVAF